MFNRLKEKRRHKQVMKVVNAANHPTLSRKEFRGQLVKHSNRMADLNISFLDFKREEFRYSKHKAAVNAQLLKRAVLEAMDDYVQMEGMRMAMDTYLKETLQKSEEMNEDKKNMEEKTDE